MVSAQLTQSLNSIGGMDANPITCIIYGVQDTFSAAALALEDPAITITFSNGFEFDTCSDPL